MRATLTTLLLGAISTPVAAGLPANCIDRLIDKSVHYLVQVEEAVKRQSSRAENDLGAVRKTWGEFARYYKGRWAADCLAAAGENTDKYNVFLKERATPVMHLARERSEEICSAEGTRIIDEGMAEIDAAIATQDKGKAEGAIRRLENKLTRKEMLAKCRPIKDRVAALLQTELPNLRANADQIQHLQAVGRHYALVARLLEQTDKAIAEQGLAPLEGRQSQTDFSNAVDRCMAGTAALDAAGFAEDGVVATQGGRSVTLAQARQPCERASEQGLDALFAKIQAHNERYRKEWRAAWETKHLKGDAMKQVYDANHHHLPRVEELGDMVVWTYWSHTTGALFAECKAYSFNGNGSSLISRKVYACE